MIVVGIRDAILALCGDTTCSELLMKESGRKGRAILELAHHLRNANNNESLTWSEKSEYLRFALTRSDDNKFHNFGRQSS
jgi:hypothetical protein